MLNFRAKRSFRLDSPIVESPKFLTSQSMSRQAESYAEDDCEWICNFLSDYDSELLNFELDTDGQHFYNNIDHLLAESPPSAITNDAVVGQHSHEVVRALPISYRAMLEESQNVITTFELRSRSLRRAATTPRNRRVGGLQRCELTAASTPDNAKSSTRSSSIKTITRRLF